MTSPRQPRNLRPRQAQTQEADQRLTVLKLETPSQLMERPAHRPAKLKMPPMPQEIFDGMTALEQEHFKWFVEAMREDYQVQKQSDFLGLYMAGLEYINLLRVQAQQMNKGEVITAARQHPGVQLRAWLETMGTTRKSRKEEPQDPEREAFLRRFGMAGQQPA